MTRVATIKFRTAGKHYDFNAREIELETGDRVIVETDRGRALGIIVSGPVEIDTESEKRELKNIIRLATEEDMQLATTNAAREETALRYCRSRVIEKKMEMKLVKAEYLFDGSKIIFYFTADGRIDFRELVKDLAHHFHTRIEMRQIGVRDEAKLIGGIGICGQALCCCSFLTEFSPVSVKMAKEQQLALNPNKISGQCGRLLCCLSYEYETYCKLRKGMPKHGLKLTADGLHAQVCDIDILGQKVGIRIEDGRNLKLSKDEFRQLQESGKLPEQESTLNDIPAFEPKPKPKPAPKPEKQDSGTEENKKPKKRRRRRRRKPSSGDDGSQNQQQGGNRQSDSNKEKPKQKPESGKPQPDNKPTQQQSKDGSAPTGEQKKRRRRRPRRSGPKPESKDKT